MMKKKIVIGIVTILIIGLGIGGYYYYKNIYLPASLVNSFLEELEFKGADLVNDKYFVSESYTNIILPWDKYYELKSNSGISKEVLYKNWEQTYFSEIGEYIIMNKVNYDKHIMQVTGFRNTFNKLDFSEIKVDYKEFRNNFYVYYGHVTIRAKNTFLYPEMNGKKKFLLAVVNGKLGWKIIGFDLNM